MTLDPGYSIDVGASLLDAIYFTHINSMMREPLEAGWTLV